MKKETKAKYTLNETVKLLQERGYGEATVKRVRYVTEKKKYIKPARLNSQKAKSKYQYSEDDIKDLEMLFDFMALMPSEEANSLKELYRGSEGIEKALEDVNFIKKLYTAGKISLEKGPWAELNDSYKRMVGQKEKIDMEGSWTKIYAAQKRARSIFNSLNVALDKHEKIKGWLKDPDCPIQDLIFYMGLPPNEKENYEVSLVTDKSSKKGEN